MKTSKIFSILVFLALCTTQVFSASMDPRVRKVPAAVTEKAFSDPENGLEPLVKSLVGSSSNVSDKTKVIHDWICDNIAYNVAVFDGAAGKQDYVTVMQKKLATCTGYANLFKQMCTIANVECIRIDGWSKGFGYEGYVTEQENHSWNAVKMGSKWQLIDVTWDAGRVDYKTFIKQYTTEYLSRTPEQFIYSHLPNEEVYQYLKKPRTVEEFETEPYIPGKFFDVGLSLGTNAPLYTNTLEGSVKFDFKLTKTDSVIQSDMLEATKKTFVKNSTWQDKTGQKITIEYDIPSKGSYVGRIFAKSKTSTAPISFFETQQFEKSVLPRAKTLLEEKKITQKELDFFTSSYFLVSENRRYYYKEDLFDTPRITAVNKILKLLEENEEYKEVLSFNLNSAASYSGYGSSVVRFPSIYKPYTGTTNTHLISPIQGTLKGGETYKFEFESKDYTSFAIVKDGKLSLIPKDTKTGHFILEYEVPKGITEFPIYCSKNGKNFVGLLYYIVSAK